MGASGSARRDGQGPEDGEERSAEAQEEQGGELGDAKLPQKNGQISSLNGTADDQTVDVEDQVRDDKLEEVGQTDSGSQKEDGPETVEPLPEGKEEAPPVTEEKEEETPDANEVMLKETSAEEEQKAEEAGEVGFKKIFRFVGFKFTLKKDKAEKTEPVQLLTVKKEEGEPSKSNESGESQEGVKVEGSAEEAREDGAAEEAKEEAKEDGAVEEAKENGAAEEAKEDGAAEEAKEDGAAEEAKEDGAVEEAKEDEAAEEAREDGAVEEAKEESSLKELALKEKEEKLLVEEQAAEYSAGEDKVKEEALDQITGSAEPTQEATPDKETEPPGESPTSPPVQGIQSPLKRFFTQGIFSNLRKRASFKKPREEEPPKEVKVEEEIKETEETAETAAEEAEKTSEQDMTEAQQEQQTIVEEIKTEALTEQGPTLEQKEDETKADIPVECDVTESALEPKGTLPVESSGVTVSTEEKPEDATEGKTSPEEVPAGITTEAELLSSQEKAKVQGSPLKKLLTGTGLKKLSSKKQKSKKEAETKLTESGEQVSEQLQSSTESAEAQKGESSPSSPEESAEHVFVESGQTEGGHEYENDAVTSDGEKKKDGILPWASFKKLVTPKKRVKRSSESEDETVEKPKSATLSSTDSTEKQEEPKSNEDEQKTEVSTEEPKKKIDTSVSWEALICVGSAKKRARKTSDSEDEAPKIEEEAQASGEEHGKTAESPLGSSQEADREHLSSPEQAGSPSETDGVSTWESLKRFVTPRRKAKAEEKVEEPTGIAATEQVPSDSEIPKEESSFSLKKLIPGRKKKKSEGKQEQVSSDEAGRDKGSAEEDSDTPAVVPLSEYDSEQAEQVDLTPKDRVEVVEKQTETPEAQESKKDEPLEEAETAKSSDVVATAAAHHKAVADVEERSPSWISPTAVEDLQETKQPLSDIPEEGDTIATPRSTAEEVSRDDTIAEDIIELTSEAVTAVEQVPEVSLTEETSKMVTAVSRLTESPGTSGEVTPVHIEYDIEKTEAIVQEVVQTISITENVQSVTLPDVHREAVAVSITPQVMESAAKEETAVLAPHRKSEAVAICTGLDTQEIESAEEKTLQTSVESLTEVGEVLPTEIGVEDKAEKHKVAGIGEEHIFAAEVMEIDSESRDPEPMAEIRETPKQVEINIERAKEEQEDEVLLMGEVKEMPDQEFADILQAQKAINVAFVNLVLGETEVLEEPVVSEKTPKTETEGPLETTREEPVCAESADVTEISPLEANKVEEFESTKEDIADIEHAALEEVVQCVIQEVTASMPEPPTSESREIQEAPIAVVAPATEFAVSKEMIGIVSSVSESFPTEHAEIKDEAAMERVPSVKFTDAHEIHLKEKEKEMLTVEPVFDAVVEAALTTINATVEGVCEIVEDLVVMEAEQVTQQKIPEEHSTSNIHLTVQNVAEDSEREPKAETAEDQDRAARQIFSADDMSPTTVVKDEALQDTTVDKKSKDTEARVEDDAGTKKAEDQPVEEGVKDKLEDSKTMEEPQTSTIPEQPEKMVQEAIQVETIQCESTEGFVAPVEIPQDVFAQPVGTKQETDEATQDREMKVPEQQEEEKGSVKTNEILNGEVEDKAESMEIKKLETTETTVTEVDLQSETKTEEGKCLVEAAPQEPAGAAESVVPQESQKPDAVSEQPRDPEVEQLETTAVVTTVQTLICPGLPTCTVEKEAVPREESIPVESDPEPAGKAQDAVSQMPTEGENDLKEADEEEQLEASAVVTTVKTLVCLAQAVEKEGVVPQEESTVAEPEPESLPKMQAVESTVVAEETKESKDEAQLVVTEVQISAHPALPTQTAEKDEVDPRESTQVETEPESTSKTQAEESKAVEKEEVAPQEESAKVETKQPSDKTQVDSSRDLDIPTKVADVTMEASGGQETAGEVKIQSAVVYTKDEVEVSQQEVVDHCETVETMQIEAAVELIVETKRIEPEQVKEDSSTEPSEKEDAAATKETDHQMLQPSADEVEHQALAGDEHSPQAAAESGVSSHSEGKEESEEKGENSIGNQGEIKAKGEEVGKGCWRDGARVVRADGGVVRRLLQGPGCSPALVAPLLADS
ncbi:A-kinase anchor protein 12-like [Arapaima gigas]